MGFRPKGRLDEIPILPMALYVLGIINWSSRLFCWQGGQKRCAAFMFADLLFLLSDAFQLMRQPV